MSNWLANHALYIGLACLAGYFVIMLFALALCAAASRADDYKEKMIREMEDAPNEL